MAFRGGTYLAAAWTYNRFAAYPSGASALAVIASIVVSNSPVHHPIHARYRSDGKRMTRAIWAGKDGDRHIAGLLAQCLWGGCEQQDGKVFQSDDPRMQSCGLDAIGSCLGSPPARLAFLRACDAGASLTIPNREGARALSRDVVLRCLVAHVVLIAFMTSRRISATCAGVMLD